MVFKKDLNNWDKALRELNSLKLTNLKRPPDM